MSFVPEIFRNREHVVCVDCGAELTEDDYWQDGLCCECYEEYVETGQ